MNESYGFDFLEEAKRVFKVRFVCPIVDSEWRKNIADNYTNSSVWVKRFWDNSAQEFRETVNPVLFWEYENENDVSSIEPVTPRTDVSDV